MYKKLQIRPIFNLPYSPDTKPIEACFSQVKRLYNSRRLHCLANRVEFRRDDVIREAFGTIKPQYVRNNIQRSLKILNELNF